MRDVLLGLALLEAISCSPAAPEPTPLIQEPQPATSTLQPEVAPQPAAARGAALRSELTYLSEPGRPHLLEVSFGFPDCARWSLIAPPQGGQGYGLRQVDFRSGARFYHLAHNSTLSEELLGDDRDLVLRRFEARRALCQWPDGFEWHELASEPGSPPRRQAPLAVPGEGEGSAGFLLVELGEDGLPCSITALDRERVPGEILRIEGWRSDLRPRHPTHLELWLGDQQVWTEEVQSLTNSVEFLPEYFLPTDRRETSSGGR